MIGKQFERAKRFFEITDFKQYAIVDGSTRYFLLPERGAPPPL
jgi:hypothetical protein